MIRIKVEGKNIADIWKLACVSKIRKCNGGGIVVYVRRKKKSRGLYVLVIANNGDEIEVESEDAETGLVLEELPF